MDTYNWSNYIFPPIVVGLTAIIKDMYVDGYALSDGVLLTDVGLNVVAYLLADVIVQFGVNRMFEKSPDNELLKAGTDIVIQPVIQGLMIGTIRPMIHTRQTLVTHPITFFTSFVDGLVYNIVGKYLASPLVIYFSK